MLKRRTALYRISLLAVGTIFVNPIKSLGKLAQTPPPFPGYEKAMAVAFFAKTTSEVLKNVSDAVRNLFGGNDSDSGEYFKVISRQLGDMQMQLDKIRGDIQVLPQLLVQAINANQIKTAIYALSNHSNAIEGLNAPAKRGYLFRQEDLITSELNKLLEVRNIYVNPAIVELESIPLASTIASTIIGYHSLVKPRLRLAEDRFNPYHAYINRMTQLVLNQLEADRKEVETIEKRMSNPIQFGNGAYTFIVSGNLPPSVQESVAALRTKTYPYLGLFARENPGQVEIMVSKRNLIHSSKIPALVKPVNDDLGAAYSRVITDLYHYNTLVDLKQQIESHLNSL